MLVIHLDHFTRFASAHRKDRTPSRKKIQLARDLTGLMHRDQCLDAVRQLHDVEVSGYDDEEVRLPDTRSHQDFTMLDFSQLA
jgi:hypothetical protein